MEAFKPIGTATALEAMAWLTYGQWAVLALRDICRDGADDPAALLALDERARTEALPLGPSVDGAGFEKLLTCCRDGLLTAEGRMDGMGDFVSVPYTDWLDGCLMWLPDSPRRPDSLPTMNGYQLRLCTKSGEKWGGLRFKWSELLAIFETPEPACAPEIDRQEPRKRGRKPDSERSHKPRPCDLLEAMDRDGKLSFGRGGLRKAARAMEAETGLKLNSIEGEIRPLYHSMKARHQKRKSG